MYNIIYITCVSDDMLCTMYRVSYLVYAHLNNPMPFFNTPKSMVILGGVLEIGGIDCV